MLLWAGGKHVYIRAADSLTKKYLGKLWLEWRAARQRQVGLGADCLAWGQILCDSPHGLTMNPSFVNLAPECDVTYYFKRYEV